MGHDRINHNFFDASSSFNLGKGIGLGPPDSLLARNNQSMAKGQKGRGLNDQSSQ